MTQLLIKLFVKNSKDVKDPAVRESYGKLGGTVGIVCNIFLSLIKIVVGFITASISIVADGFNNLSDMGSSVIALIGFKMAGKPADSDHPYGHGRIEYLSAFLVSVCIMLVGSELLISSVKTLTSGETAPKYTVWSVAVLAVSVILKFWMFFFNRSLGKAISSEVLSATAKDSINDCVASLAILASCAVSTFVKLPFSLDAVMGCVVSLFILWSGVSSAKGTVNEILGTPPDPELIGDIEHSIMSFGEFIGIHDLIIHNYGPGRQFASVHVEVPQDIDMVYCHEQIDLCEKLVCEQTGVQLVIHMDPIDVNNESVQRAREAMTQAIKQIDDRLTLHDFRMTPQGKTRTNLIFDVVVPSGLAISHEELKAQISDKARQVDPSFCCVVTVDNDFLGK